MALRVRCAECDREWIDSYGGRFECPSCSSESMQEYYGGYIGLDGPHTILGAPDDSEITHDSNPPGGA